MDPETIRKLLLGRDSRSNQGIFARGKNVYNGMSAAPNPMGMNQSSAAQRLLAIRAKMYGQNGGLNG